MKYEEDYSKLKFGVKHKLKFELLTELLTELRTEGYMRLTEDRIQSLARKIVKELTERKMILVKGFPTRVEMEIGRVIMQDLMIEDDINQEAERQIEAMKRNIPYGSAEWSAIFSQIKEKLSQQRNYIVS
ncbi:MAG: DUF507 family protein [Candidatus Sumerlaeota bacterium]|nr:DUF507 family protein [Candidatus Sumerlaeota bacterium]